MTENVCTSIIPIPKQIHFGAGCLLRTPEVFPVWGEMLEQGEIGHVQLLTTPVASQDYSSHLEIFESYPGYIRVHAPHHVQGVNPCNPELFAQGRGDDLRNYIEEAMAQTSEAADRTGSEIIVLHAGRYRPEERSEAIATFHAFLDVYPDDRYILETLPDLKHGYRFLGITPGELRELAGQKITGFCLDFPHLWCTAQAQGIPYHQLLNEMGSLPLKFSHLSGSPGPGSDRQHLFFDDPQNAFDLPLLRSFLSNHPDLEISLEFATDDPDIIRQQIRIASTL